MGSFSRRSARRSFRPGFEVLEARCTPATFAYNALKQSLTVKAAAGEQITISQDAAKPTGNLQVNSNLTPGIFNDPSGDTQFVKNLTVKIAAGAGAGTGQVIVNGANNLSVAGNFSVTTADTDGTELNFLTGGSIGKNLSFTSTATTATANDDISLAQVSVGGSVNLKLGSGNNVITTLELCTIGSNLTVTAKGGNDSVPNFEDNDVGGNATFNLGAGDNSLTTAGAPTAIGKNLSYTGTSGNDAIVTNAVDVGGRATFNVGAGTNNALVTNAAVSIGADLTYTGTSGSDAIVTNAAVDVGGRATFKVGAGSNALVTNAAVSIGADLAYTGTAGADTIVTNAAVDVGGRATFKVGAGGNALIANAALSTHLNFAYTGASGNDTIIFNGAVTVHGNLTANLGNGANFFGLTGGTVEGKMAVVGGGDTDNVTLEMLRVQKKLTVNLGDSTAAQTLSVVDSAALQGLALLGGNDDDTFDLAGLTVLGTTSIKTLAGNDTVNINNATNSADSFFSGPATIDTAAGNDTVRLETDTNGGTTNFGTKLSILGGAGNDDLFLARAPPRRCSSAARPRSTAAPAPTAGPTPWEWSSMTTAARSPAATAGDEPMVRSCGDHRFAPSSECLAPTFVTSAPAGGPGSSTAPRRAAGRCAAARSRRSGRGSLAPAR